MSEGPTPMGVDTVPAVHPTMLLKWGSPGPAIRTIAATRRVPSGGIKGRRNSVVYVGPPGEGVAVETVDEVLVAGNGHVGLW